MSDSQYHFHRETRHKTHHNHRHSHDHQRLDNLESSHRAAGGEHASLTERCVDPHFINSWLSEVHGGGDGSSSRPNEHQLTDDPRANSTLWRPFNKGVVDTAALKTPAMTSYQRRASWRADDCLIEPQSSEDNGSRGSIAEGTRAVRKRRSRLASPQSCDSEARSNPYQKRPRRKTRPDRYEARYRKKGTSGKEEGKHKGKRNTEDKSNMRSGTKSDRRQHRLRSGKEVMQNFSSTAIYSDKVTVSHARLAQSLLTIVPDVPNNYLVGCRCDRTSRLGCSRMLEPQVHRHVSQSA